MLVVRHDEERRLLLGKQIALQPDARVEVEVVGRLVEQQQLGAEEERACEGESHAPAARERCGGRFLLGRVEAEAGEDRARSRLARLASMSLKLLVHSNQRIACRRRRIVRRTFIGCGRVESSLQLDFLCEEFGATRVRCEKGLHGAQSGGAHLLLDVEDIEGCGEPAEGAVGNVLEQRRLATTVGSDEPILSPGAQGEACVREELDRVSTYRELCNLEAVAHRARSLALAAAVRARLCHKLAAEATLCAAFLAAATGRLVLFPAGFCILELLQLALLLARELGATRHLCTQVRQLGE